MTVSTDDLAFAAEWLDEYSDTNSPECEAKAQRVADWLRAEVEARMIKSVAKSMGVSVSVAKAAMARVKK